MIPSMFDRPSGVGALLGPGDIATPTAGYSLRYLSIDYFGQPVVEVRKDVVGNPTQNFTPSQLTDGTLATFADGNDCYVSTWYDQFGSNDATQASASAQPKIWDASTGLVTENDRPALDFDGNDDFLTVQNDSLYRNISYSHGFLVNATDSTGSTQTLHFGATGDNGSNKARINYYINSSNNAAIGGRRLDADSFASVTSTASLSVNTQYLRSSQFDFASSDLRQYINGNLDGESTSFQTDGNTSDTDSNNVAGENITIGSLAGNSNEYNGTIQEIIIYNTDQSANREAIEDNINDYYDIY